MTRYPTTILFALSLCALAGSASADPLSVPVGRTLTFSLGSSIQKLSVVDSAGAVEIRRLDSRTLAVTAVRAGQARLVLRTEDGATDMEFVVQRPVKQELASAALQEFVAEHQEPSVRPLPPEPEMLPVVALR